MPESPRSRDIIQRRRATRSPSFSPSWCVLAYHAQPSSLKNIAAIYQVKHIGNEMFTDLAFLPKGLLTATKLGQIKFWIRPLAVQARHLRTHNTLRHGSQTDAST